MKKNVLTAVCILFCAAAVQCQAKQRKELLLQIAALQVYMDYAKKGYTAVSKGLNFIGDLKKGEVNLHGDYFTSLLKINPKVKQYYKTAAIVSIQRSIMKTCTKTLSTLKAADLFHGSELEYVERSFKRLLESGGDILDELLLITAESKLQLTDDQRIERIDALHKTMLENYNCCTALSREAELLSLSKARRRADAEALSELHGL